MILLNPYRFAVAAGGGGSIPTTNQILDINPHLESYANADPVGSANDFSPANNDSSALTGTNRPIFRTGGVNGKSVFEFDGVAQRLEFNTFTASPTTTVLEVFVVIKLDADPPATEPGTGLWYSVGAGATSHFPYTDGNIYDGFATTVRKTVGNPTPNLASTYRLYNVISKSGEWTARMDTTQLFTTATNTVDWDTAWVFGTSGSPGPYRFKGRIARLLLYNADQSANRASIAAELKSLYNLTGY